VDQKAAAAPAMPPSRGAVHSAEIEYALGNLSTNNVYAWSPEDYKVSKVMQEYFANFIKKGDPNGRRLPRWAAATNSGGSADAATVMRLDVESHAEPDKHRSRYLFLDKSAQKP
jgi:para-nitrobenzyl esterase